VARAKKCGFDVLEVNAPKVTLMSKAEQDKLKAAAAAAGLSLTYSIGMMADMARLQRIQRFERDRFSAGCVECREVHGWDSNGGRQLLLLAAEIVAGRR